MKKDRTLSLIIRSKDSLVFKGEVYELVSFNQKGEFTILPDHEQFITTIDKKLTYKDEKGNHQLDLATTCLMRVYKNQISVFL